MSSINYYNVTEPTECWVVFDRITRILQSAWTLRREADHTLRNNNEDAVVQATLPIYRKVGDSELYVQSDGTVTTTSANLVTLEHVRAERIRIPLELHMTHPPNTPCLLYTSPSPRD